MVVIGIVSNHAEVGPEPAAEDFRKERPEERPYAKLREKAGKLPENRRIAVDPTGEMAQLFQARTTPQCFVIDATGKLVYAGGLDDDRIEARGVEQRRRVSRRRRQAAEPSVRRHAPDEDVDIGRVRLQADAIAENGAAGERTAGIDGNHAYRQILFTEVSQETPDQSGFPGPGWSRDAKPKGRPRRSHELAQRENFGGGRPFQPGKKLAKCRKPSSFRLMQKG